MVALIYIYFLNNYFKVFKFAYIVIKINKIYFEIYSALPIPFYININEFYNQYKLLKMIVKNDCYVYIDGFNLSKNTLSINNNILT